MAEPEPSKTIHVSSLIRMAEGFEEIRADWIERLAKNPKDSKAAEMILEINAKVDMLDILLRGAYVFRGINDKELK